MDASSLEAYVYDPSKCSKLSLDQKRELIYEVSKWSNDGAVEMLHGWSRQEILQVLCVELGKERKYTGLTKSKIIEQLLKVVQEKNPTQDLSNAVSEAQTSSDIGERTPKRQKSSALDADSGRVVYCENSACKAKLNHDDAFCKRCSCCICRKYDDNKDPSLWLVCNSDSPFQGRSCGMSCHLECALRHENSGISVDRRDKGLDGSFCCVSCGKVNDLLCSLRKQLVEARDTRRVDILGYRLSLGQKILFGTNNYKNLCQIIDEAIEKLEEEVGPLTGLPVKKARGIVNRLSSGPEIQRICGSAVDTLDSILSERVSHLPSDHILASRLVRFEDIQASSVKVVLNSDFSNVVNVVGYMLWHRKADDKDYPAEATCRLFVPNTRYLLTGLTPSTEYFLKVVTHDRDGELGFDEFQFQTLQNPSLEVESSQSPSSLSNPSSVEDDRNTRLNIPSIANAVKTGQRVVERNTDNGLLQKATIAKEGKMKGKGIDVESMKRSGESKDLEYYVKMIRWLECDGYIETSFRQKFLTWYGLRATPQEVKIVKVFVDTFVEDPQSLADQLKHTFNDIVCNNKCSNVPSGFCLKLWH